MKRSFCVFAIMALTALSIGASGIFGQGTDPLSVVTAFDTAVNSQNVDAVLALVADDAVIKTQTATLSGKDQIQVYVKGLAAQHFQFQLVGSRQVTGDKETHTARVSYDDLKKLGLSSLEATAKIIVQGGKIKSFTVSFSPDSLAKLQAAQAAAQATPRALPATGRGDFLPELALALLGSLTVLSGLLLKHRQGHSQLMR